MKISSLFIPQLAPQEKPLTSLSTNLATIARQWLRLASIGLALLLSQRPLHAQATLDTAGPLLSFSKRLEVASSAKDTWLFSRVASIAVDKRGQIFVLDDIECNIQVFDSKGTRIRSLGRKGAGPGEMSRPTMLQILGDTVYVHDRGNARFVSFSAATGKVVLNRRGTPGERPFGLSPRGTFRELFAAQAVATNASKIASTIIHTAIATNRSDTLAKPTSVYSDLSYYMYRNVLPSVLAPAKGAVVHTAQPFDDQMLLKAAPSGDYIVLAERVAGVNGSRSSRRQPSALRIRRISPSGKTLAEFTFNTVERPVSASDISKVVDSLSNLMMAPGAKYVARASDIRDSLHRPATWPLATQIFVGEDGVTWLRQPQPPSANMRFWRIDSDGKLLPSVSVPGSISVLYVSQDAVWGSATDEEGNPIVQVYRNSLK